MRYQFAIDIDRPVETVWEFSNDFFNAPRLGGQAIVFRQTSPGGPGLGATYEGRMMILGFETRVHGSFTEWEPLRAMTASMSARPLKWARLRETYEPTPTGTRMVRAMELDLRFPLNILAPILMPFVIRRWQHANASIKRILESIPDEEVRASTEPVAAIGPSVHRTIMFTDIVGSTQLIGVIGDAAWRDLRRWHDATLRTTFERHHGRELDHAGDGFSVAFESAADGVSCAVEIERTLIGHRRTAGFAPQLRIGLHTGELQRDGDGLTGSALHVASRIAASAAGGEILATISTFAESGVTPASPPTEISLRGISEPVAVAAVAW